ncbi:hypothetical protein A9Q96_01620 [Rhodobacterales bacterium 52_120_T64]|nr:hypothetical protein A9Q96_01620 [Rhodobacterales bacterium 52_120_T64]
MQKKFIVLALAAIVLSGCDTYGETLGLGAGIGAGAAVLVGGDPVTGALVGLGGAALCEEGVICNR